MINWPRIFKDLKAHGWTTYRISEHLGVARGTISGWKLYGAEPPFEDGWKLLCLWSEATLMPLSAVLGRKP